MEPVAKIESSDAYLNWAQAEGVPIVKGAFIEDVGTLALKPWARKGVRGAILNMDGASGLTDMHVVEIAPGKESVPERHIFEELVRVISGSGTTTVWLEGGPKHTFEWGPGSLFPIPVNASYQHFNVSGSQPARYVAVTNAPLLMRVFHNSDFVFNNPFVFKDRFSADDGFFEKGQYVETRNPRIKRQSTMSRTWETNFVPDLRALQLQSWAERGGGGSAIGLVLGEAGVGAHVAQFAPATYKLAHRHFAGAHVLVLGGVGYALMWRDGDKTRQRFDYKTNSLFVPGAEEWHQWFSTGAEPTTYHSMSAGGGGRHMRLAEFFSNPELSEVGITQGGDQIEYFEEDPAIHREFEADLAKHGVKCVMRGLVAGCTGEALKAEKVGAR